MKIDLSKFEVTGAHMNLMAIVSKDDVVPQGVTIGEDHPMHKIKVLENAAIERKPVEIAGVEFDVQQVTYFGLKDDKIQYNITIRQKHSRGLP